MWFEHAVMSSGGETANEIYANMFLTVKVGYVPKPRKPMQVQRVIGLEVIDTNGSVIGSVKDVAVEFQNKDVSLKVTTKNKTEMEFSWDDVQSVEDVVLLKRGVDLSATKPNGLGESSNAQAVQALVICPSCGSSAPVHAMYCSKCGCDLKS
jgi:sporulation protein YlmC with PRC-barrel domain